MFGFTTIVIAILKFVTVVLMRDDKQLAIKLRMEGMAYSKITAELGISTGTLSLWFKDIKSLQGTKKTYIRRSNTMRGDT